MTQKKARQQERPLNGNVLLFYRRRGNTVFERLHSCTVADTLIRQLELLEADKASGPDELQPRNLSEEETENPWQDH